MNSKYEGYSRIMKTYGIVIVFFIIVIALSPDYGEEFGIISVCPAAFLLFYVFYTKRILESLMLGGLLGYDFEEETIFAHRTLFCGTHHIDCHIFFPKRF
jgi:hypothetical protein